MASFAGFDPGLIKFLTDLEKNNNRKWFERNKGRYEEFFMEPALAFIEAMQKPLANVSPYFPPIAKRSGGSLMRIYRDVRFSKDKKPYKTNMGIHFRHEVGKDVHAPGFYFHIDPKEIFVGAGIWRPDSKTLGQIRKRIDEEPATWKRASRGKALTSNFEFHGDSLKRPPRGFDKDHPLIDDLKRKDFILVTELPSKAIFKKTLPTELTNMLKKSKPYVRFLCDAIPLPF